MPIHASRMRAAALILSTATLTAGAQDSFPDRFRATPAWTPGEKHTYQVQQVVKERAGGKDETRFLSNGTLEITAIETTADTVTFTWHRRMENADLELAREPWGIRGNAPYERLLISTVRDGLPLTVKLDLRTQRARVENREDLVSALSRRLQSVGAEFSAAPGGRLREPTPDQRNTRDPSNAAVGIHQPLAKHDATKYANTPRNANVVAAWYARLASAEIEDFLGVYGREFQLDNGSAPSGAAVRTYRPTAQGEVLVSLSSAPTQPDAAPPSKDEDEKEGEPKSAGLAGGPVTPVAYEAKIEMTVPSGWPKRAAIVRTEADTNSPESKRATQRRVYLRQ